MAYRRATRDDVEAIIALTEAAYLPNESLTGAVSLPRMADYETIVATHEVWLAQGDGGTEGVLVLEPQPGHFTLWSIAVAPAAAGRGLGSKLMRFCEDRARALGYDAVLLYTNALLTPRVQWYQSLGYEITHHEDRADRRLVHMRKKLEPAPQGRETWQDV